MSFLSLKTVLVTSLLMITQLTACTGLLLTADDGSTVNGRTVEFAIPLEMNIAMIPRNYKFIGDIPQGNGMLYKSKYASIGIFCFDTQVLMDGMNEKGLVAAAFYFPGFAKYAEITSENRSKALSPIEFPNWILTQFATLEEVKAALPSVVIAPTISKNWGSAPPPMHYIVYDKSGRSIVIEPIDGKLIVHENRIGVITNSPPFDWHLINLSNYINLTPYNIKQIDIKSFTIDALGQGSGMLGLPGDFTPPSRFIRAAFFSSTAFPSKTSEKAVYQTFHILNQFDIPVGAVRDSATSFDSTSFTSVKDPQALKYYYRTYDDQTIKFIDLLQFDLNQKRIQQMKIKGTQHNIDISAQLQ